MHYWGDDWPHWDDLYKAQEFIFDYVYKRSLTRCITKEKYGTIRYQYLFIPGTSIRLGPHIKLGGRIVWRWSNCWIAKLWRRYSYWLLRRAIFLAVSKWPHLEDELLSDASEELVGKEIHSRYWQ